MFSQEQKLWFGFLYLEQWPDTKVAYSSSVKHKQWWITLAFTVVSYHKNYRKKPINKQDEKCQQMHVSKALGTHSLFLCITAKAVPLFNV